MSVPYSWSLSENCSTLMDQQPRSSKDRSPQVWSLVWPNHIRDMCASGVVGQKSRRGRKLQFSTEEIMGAQNFNFAFKFSQTGFFGPKFCSLGRQFSTRRKFSDNFSTAQNGGGQFPHPVTTPLMCTVVSNTNIKLNRVTTCCLCVVGWCQTVGGDIRGTGGQWRHLLGSRVRWRRSSQHHLRSESANDRVPDHRLQPTRRENLRRSHHSARSGRCVNSYILHIK